MNDKDKILLYIHLEHGQTNITESDIEITGSYLVNGRKYEAICSRTHQFIPFAFSDTVQNYYKTQKAIQFLRNEKLKKIKNYDGNMGS